MRSNEARQPHFEPRDVQKHVPDRGLDAVQTLRQAQNRAVAPSTLVALPIYNVAPQVPAIVRQCREFVAEHPEFRLVLVDDASTDGTGTLLASLLNDDDTRHLALIRQPENGGKWQAIRTAFKAAFAQPYAYVMFTDGDLAYSLDHLPRLAEALADSDVAIGCRLGPDASYGARLTRRVMGWTFNKAVRLCVSWDCRDSQAGLKGFRADAARKIFGLMTISDLAADVEILFLARRLGLRISEVPAHVSADHRAIASTVDLVRDPVRMLVSLLRIRFNSLVGRYGRSQ